MTGEFVAADLSLPASRHKIRLPRSPRPTTTPVTAAKVAGPTTTPAPADSAGPRVSVEPVHGAVMERSNHGTIQRKGASVSLITEAPRAWIAHLRPHGAWGNVRGAAAPKPPQHGGPGTSNFIEASQSPQTLKDALPLPFIRYTHAKPPPKVSPRRPVFVYTAEPSRYDSSCA